MRIDKALVSAGFTEAPTQTVKRLILSVSGLEKQGKTAFALTAPGPIALFDSDMGTEGVVERFAKEKEIIRFDARVPHTPDDAEELWSQTENAFYVALQSDDIRTLVFDTATEIWELLRLSKFGKLTQVMPYHYGPVNALYRKMIREVYKSDKNLILLHKMKPLYINDKRTRDYERSGFGDTGFLVQANTRVSRDMEDEGDFCIEIIDSRHKAEMAGEVLTGPMCSFPMLASVLMDDTGPSDWE